MGSTVLPSYILQLVSPKALTAQWPLPGRRIQGGGAVSWPSILAMGERSQRAGLVIFGLRCAEDRTGLSDAHLPHLLRMWIEPEIHQCSMPFLRPDPSGASWSFEFQANRLVCDIV